MKLIVTLLPYFTSALMEFHLSNKKKKTKKTKTLSQNKLLYKIQFLPNKCTESCHVGGGDDGMTRDRSSGEL